MGSTGCIDEGCTDCIGVWLYSVHSKSSGNAVAEVNAGVLSTSWDWSFSITVRTDLSVESEAID